MTYAQTCPRGGRDFDGDDPDALAEAIVEHARVDHGHALDPGIVLAHGEAEPSDAGDVEAGGGDGPFGVAGDVTAAPR